MMTNNRHDSSFFGLHIHFGHIDVGRITRAVLTLCVGLGVAAVLFGGEASAAEPVVDDTYSLTSAGSTRSR